MPVRLLTGVANARLPEFEPVPVAATHPGRKKVPPFWMQAVTSGKPEVKMTPGPELRAFVASTFDMELPPDTSPETLPETATSKPEIVALPLVVLTVKPKFKDASPPMPAGIVIDEPGAAEMVNEGARGLLASGVITKAEGRGLVTPFSDN